METKQITSILPLLKATNFASTALRKLSNESRIAFLEHLAHNLLENIPQILEANQKDMDNMDPTDPKLDRLMLNESRIKALAQSTLAVAQLQDPTNKIIEEKILPNGIRLIKKSVALGVVGVIFEARPNVTIDITAICIKSGNAVVLKGGTDAQCTNEALLKIIHTSLKACNMPTSMVCLLPAGREYVKEMLEAEGLIDIIIPRGSESLIKFVRQNSLVPTIETGAGVCHTYVHEMANIQMATNIVVNAKTTRVSVCNSLDTILVDKAIAETFIQHLIPKFKTFEVEIFADETAFNILQNLDYPYLQKAKQSDFGREYLSLKCSLKVVENLDEAMIHIYNFSSKHSEAIVSENAEICEKFIDEVDAAAVYANASTRFTDGGEFGLGAEIGISTQKLHARGPFALEKLVTEKWVGYGNGQIR